jgi:predicted acylesterase/phospholipase RssA
MRKKCDLVMKGGITSGIVYPRAVHELAQEFEFENIGGASAGAIAASLTAAAELQRRTTGSDAGFRKLEKLPDWLGETVDGRSRLMHLFQPTEATKPFYEIGVRWLETKNVFAVIRRLLRYFNSWGGAALGVLALAVLVAFGASRIDGPLAIGVLAGALVIAAVAGIGFVIASAVEALVAFVRTIPQANFGLCDGYAIAEWLMSEIDATANITDHPVTFGDLRKAGVNLEMMTTNLTFAQPDRMPWTSRMFYFSEKEFSTLFPRRVVQWMIEHSQPLGDDLHQLPQPDDLPVIVAARMSMSFPILLAAVPLYSIDFGRIDKLKKPERCWFSDGGIGSNFPVHFFDAPLPSWPTFAINLGEWSARYHTPEQTIFAARHNKGGVQAWWSPFQSLAGFLGAIFETLHNWRDNSLLRMPGYRDRIAHVLLREGEGGLNLTMDAEMIRGIAARGQEAAVALRQRFGDQIPPPAGVTLSWANHRWVRFRSFMRALETALRSFEKSFDERMFDAPPSYKPPRLHEMRERTIEFVKHVRADFGDELFQGRPYPRPPSTLRTMPEV